MRCAMTRKKNVRFKLTIVALLLIVIGCIVHFHIRDTDKANELKFFKENLKLLNSANETECKLPQYDLYDPEIRKYVDKPPTSIHCGYAQPYLTYMDWNGLLYLNKTEVSMNEYKDLRCTYEVITGNKNDDYKVDYGDLNAIDYFPIPIKYSVVRVQCENNGEDIYTMIHSQILPPKSDLLKKNHDIPSNRPSVLIFVVDSMSRGNFIRSLPMTYSYLTEKQNFTVFEGLNKVADNTFPNMMALLTGFIGYPREDMSHVPQWTIDKNSTIKRYDDMPIIWKTFKESGYFTMYAEEYLDATFSYLDVGFREDPVDYYYRSTYVSLKENLANLKYNKLKFWNRSKWRYCLANEPSYKYMLNYTEEFLVEMANLRYFALSFFVEMSHEYLTDVQNMDDDLYGFFKRNFEKGNFENTVILVMGDHGHRFDSIRSTYIGRIEERMPFLGIHLPKSLSKFKTVLKSHAKRLLSWYDIHQTLVDIALDDLGENKRFSQPGAIGKSLFRYFDDYRTCIEIGILPEYCICDREAQIQTTATQAHQSADILMNHMNNLLSESAQYLKPGDNRKCANLKLNKIHAASVFVKSSSSEHPLLIVRIIFEVTPSEGKFEGAVAYNPSSEPKVFGDINRINKYGDQPSCILHDILRLYCYCE